MSERDHFEARAAEKLRLAVNVIQSARNGDRYLHAFDSMNVMQPLDGWWDWWQASREVLKAEQGGDGWIACSDRMPDQVYVVAADFSDSYYSPCIPNTQIAIYGDWFNDGNPTWDDGDGEDLQLRKVTHWMPIPAPPSRHPIDTTPNQYDALGKGEGK
ncbi:DUF551 domain-containing protein [Pseudescherichia vulneris]|uniref:DUF551 domain-containing protein n=1 Tax=Pseudescherichia vulneris TaxID=566 RepID=UPI0028D17F03|nr:DUF551 domain-containing protein [Pseudescherichia vulneris]